MTATEYFALDCPTPDDFSSWTRSLFDRADAAARHAASLYPDRLLGRIVKHDAKGYYIDLKERT